MADKKEQRRGLGRGLSALMADIDQPEADRAPDTPRRAETAIPIELIEPNPDQPRRSFDPDRLEELATSIAQRGIIQPLILRRHPADPSRYQIVAGERRWRAAQVAKLHEIPAIVREFDDIEVLEVAIIENIQRADLNPVDEAASYRQLMDRFGHTQEKVAEALGKSRPHIANALRLLTLPKEVLTWLGEGKLTAGHARALVSTDSPAELARQVIAKGLSVRATEALARKPKTASTARSSPRIAPDKDADTRALEQDLSAALGMKVSVEHIGSGGRGRLTIDYASLDELDTLCQALSRDGD